MGAKANKAKTVVETVVKVAGVVATVGGAIITAMGSKNNK